jgi:hypothetical protein
MTHLYLMRQNISSMLQRVMDFWNKKNRRGYPRRPVTAERLVSA